MDAAWQLLPAKLFPALGHVVPLVAQGGYEGSRTELLAYLKKEHRKVLKDVAFLEIKVFGAGGDTRSWYHLMAPAPSLHGFKQIVGNLVAPDDGQGKHYSIGRNEEFLSKDNIVIIPVTAREPLPTTLEWEEDRYDLDDLTSHDGLENSSLDEAMHRFRDLLDDTRFTLVTQQGAPVRAVICCNLKTSEVVDETERSTVSQIFLGIGARSLHRDKLLPTKKMRDFLADVMLLIYRSMAAPIGRQLQQTEFAHQTSRIIDSIAEFFSWLPVDPSNSVRIHLLAKIQILRAVINSYRDARQLSGEEEFPYPWEEGGNPFAAYRDIAIMLGFARGQSAPAKTDQRVRDVSAAAKWPENQMGEKGFETYRGWVVIPEQIPAWALALLQSRSFAVLASMVLSQAFYHTVRARFRDISPVVRSDPIMTVGFAAGTNRRSLNVLVDNPDVTAAPNLDDQPVLISKDAAELAALAAVLPHLRDGANGHWSFRTVGPRYLGKGCWRTEILCEKQDDT